MFGIGLPELVIILVIALVVFGPKKLPDLAKSLGKGLAEFKKAGDELKSTIETDLRVDLNEDTYHPVTPLPSGTPASSEPKPADAEGVPSVPGQEPAAAASDSALEDFERGKIVVAENQETALTGEPSPPNPPQKEKDQAAVSQEPKRPDLRS